MSSYIDSNDKTIEIEDDVFEQSKKKPHSTYLTRRMKRHGFVKSSAEAKVNDSISKDTSLAKADQSPVKRNDKPLKDSESQEQISIHRLRKSLPIWPFRKELLSAIKQHQVLVVKGETGAGKSTQIPQYLYDAGYCKNGKKIGCSQPRQVAALSVAARVAEEMGKELGQEVGYSTHFKDCTSENTVIKYLTDDALLRELLTERNFDSYSVIIIDEAHERTLHTDILLALLKDIAHYRTDLKILVISATDECEKFSVFFDEAPVFRLPKKRFPVDIFYAAEPIVNYLNTCLVMVWDIHVKEEPGDIIVFLPSQKDLQSMQEMLCEHTGLHGSRKKKLIVFSLYDDPHLAMHPEIFKPVPPGARKCILTTHIAETSLAIENIAYVVDIGLREKTSYNAQSGTNSRQLVPISKISAAQRANNAGRAKGGKCFRLYTGLTLECDLKEKTEPEIKQSNLAQAALFLKVLGFEDLTQFDYLDPPPVDATVLALDQLYTLGALDATGQLTKVGIQMAQFTPMDPMMAKALVSSAEYKCSEEIVTIAAMLSVGSSVFYRPRDEAVFADSAHKRFSTSGGDHFTLLNVYNRWVESGCSAQWCFENFILDRAMRRARDVRDQLVRLMARTRLEMISSPKDLISINRAIDSGFFYIFPNTLKISHF